LGQIQVLQRDIDDTAEPDHGTEPDHLPDPMLDQLRAAAAVDTDYRDLVAAISSGFPNPRDKTPMSVRSYWAIREALSVDNGIALFGRRIIVPLSARREVLGKLHAAHRQTVYWPGISNEITFLVESCQPCQERRPHHQQEPLLRDPLPTRVFKDVSTDLFQFGQLHVLVYVDRLSGWPVVHRTKT
jgi:hypothetical protein